MCAKVTGPLFSISASGTVAKSMTFSSWKGISYVREWFTPANPQTAKQTNNRTALSLLVESWQGESGSTQDFWNEDAQGYAMSGFNLYVKKGLKAYIAQLGVDTTPVSVSVAGNPPDDVWTWSDV